ncbi:alpha/beta-hydrolase [Aaosphaeria arxii CBS 175.79]|uniref:Alpha/beta-hydrolase n=1 Tax=Aaosphaeria arxii CBS 175.79 TaxID=1450172 RepID=A0A6A5Y294_9PLEO|nr:alpha/beta-hydrolase [Aaosphaeria arxii CBS 175.79]KAF2019376.1 alpha/beta-hydrolase [Aaosphaeria arxii CBS 175.79]
MSSKPAIVFVPGSFAPAPLYDNLHKPVESHGLSLTVVDLVTVGKKPGPPPTIYDDASHIASVVSKLVDEGKDVVLICHSYGGIPTTQSTKGLTKKEREAEGKKGGIVRLAYMTALAVDVGMSAQGALEGAATGPLGVDEDGWMYQVNPEETAPLVFGHLPLDDQVIWVKKFAQHSAVSFANELTHPGYNDVPVSYLFCEDDKCVLPSHQQAGIDRIEKSSGQKVDVTRLNSDHCPSVSHLDETVSWIVGLAEKGGQ